VHEIVGLSELSEARSGLAEAGTKLLGQARRQLAGCLTAAV
jgi:hypothetical protein